MSGIEQRFALLLHRSAAVWRAKLDERLRPWGMSYTTWRTLWILRTSEDLHNQSSLATRLGIETPTLVRILDRMEALGLLQRTADPADRRQKHVEITARGLRLSDEMEVEVVSLRKQIITGLGEEELARCVTLLERIIDNAGDSSQVACVDVAHPIRRPE